MGINTPAEILDIWVKNGVKKANLPAPMMLVLGMLAGAYIGFGAFVFILATSAGGDAFQSMLSKFIGAALFPVGLMLVILCGAELFTGNNLLTLALMNKKITAGQMLKNWCIVYAGNLIGSVLLAFLLANSGLLADTVSDRAIAVAVSKTSMPIAEAVIRGILCNMLVVLACWLQAGSKEMIGKIFGIWFPIMLFVFAGFVHTARDLPRGRRQLGSFYHGEPDPGHYRQPDRRSGDSAGSIPDGIWKYTEEITVQSTHIC